MKSTSGPGRRALYLALWLSAAAMAAIMAFAACGTRHSGSGGLQAAERIRDGGLQSTDSVIAELDEMECPEGVDSALWVELKAALEAALLSTPESRLSSRDSVLKESRLENRDSFSDVARSASTPPTGEANRVNDLAITDNGDGSYTLTWRYRNLGDYDQDGKVSISDITPIAQHFNETYDPETEPNSIQAVIDGSGNGKVDIADVTAIAQCFQVEVDHYVVEGIDDYELPYVEVAQVALPEGTRTARLEIAHDLGVPPYRYWRVAPVDADGARGQTSNVVSTQPGEPPEILSVSPIAGDSGTEATFSAEVTGDGPLEYAWNFGSGASPNQFTQPEPTATLSRGGTLPEPVKAYPAALTVNTPYGAATYPFDLSVSAWWHIEEIPKVPGHEEDEIEQALYDYGPDGSLWGVHRYPGVNKYLIRWLGETFEWEQLPWDHVYDSVAYLRVDREGRPAVLGSEYTGVLQWEPFFAIRTEEGWEQEEIERTGQLLFDSANRAVMVYGALWVARRTGPGEWEKTRVWEAAGEVNYANAEIRVDDRLELVFSDAGTLCYGKEEQGNWLVERLKESFIDEEDYTHRFFPLDIALNVGSEPSILFGEVEYGSGYYPTAVFVAEAAHIEAAEQVYYYNTTSPALLPGLDALAKLPDTVLVTFNDPSQSNQFFAWRCESVWTSAVFPTPEFYGAEVRVATDGMPIMVGKTHIARHW